MKVFRSWLVLVVAAALTDSLSAQTAPQIGYLFPAGAQQGSRVSVTLGGKYMPGPCGVWVGGQGVVSRNRTTQGTLDIVVDQAATPGPRAVRIHSIQGGSSPQQFIVGELPEVIESQDATTQLVRMPVTINGQLNPKGDVDEFQLKLQPRQQIVCAANVKSLGSPGDTILRLIDANQRVVATGDDHRGLDPLLVYQCETAGTFTLQIYNFDLAGGPEHVYRLTVTDGPFLEYAFPAGVQRGKPTSVSLHGWNLPGHVIRHTVKAIGDSHLVHLPGCANRLALTVNNFNELNEAEPNDTPQNAQVVAPLQVVNGRLVSPGDVDVFRWSAKKGDRSVIQVESADLGFEADIVMRISNAAGKLLKEIDDVRPSRDPSFTFSAPADGDYWVSIADRAMRGGQKFVYRLVLRPLQPAIQLTVKTTEFAIRPGGSLTIPVRVVPLDGFSDEVELSATGLPDGVSLKPLKHTPMKAAEVKLEFDANAKAPFVSGPFQIVARSAADGAAQQVFAVARSAVAGPMPAKLSETLWMSVGPHVPFKLSIPSTIQESPRLAAFPHSVSVKRDDGFRSAIRLIGVDPDRRGTVIPLSGFVQAEQDSGSIPLIIQPHAIEGTTHRCRVMGVVDVTGPDGKQYPVFHVAKGSILLGCQPNLLTLRADPNRIECQPGESFELQLTIGRRVELGEVTITIPKSLAASGLNADLVKFSPTTSTATMRIQQNDAVKRPTSIRLQLQAETMRDGLPVYAEAEVLVLTR